MTSSRKSKEHIIPVVFDVTTETETREIDAARMLVSILADAKLMDRPRYGRGYPQGRIESWHMQNHPAADRSDHEGVIVFYPLRRPDRNERMGGNDEPSDQMQREIDWFLETTGRWLKDG